MNTSRTYLSNSQRFLSADGSTGYTPSKQEIQESQDLTNQLLAARQKKLALEAETGCKKPLLNIGKKKKKYEQCLADNKKAKDDAAKREQEIIDMQRQAMNKPSVYTPPPPPKTFLFMPQEIGIPVVIIAASIIAFFGYTKIIQPLINKTKN